MAIINPAIPQIYMPSGTTSQPNIQSYSVSSHCKEGDIVVLSGGQIAPAGNNPAANILGVCVADSDANYAGQTTLPINQNYWSGFSQVGSLLVPQDAALTLVALDIPPALIEINLTASTGWVTGGSQQVDSGSLVGFVVVDGIYLADPTQSNQIATIVQPVIVPGPGVSQNPSGNLGQRVRVAVSAAALPYV